jgi:hypothetical protein
MFGRVENPLQALQDHGDALKGRVAPHASAAATLSPTSLVAERLSPGRG